MSENVLSPLDTEGLEREVAAALQDIAAADDVESLKAVRSRYNGDKAPLTLAKTVSYTHLTLPTSDLV